MAKKDETAAPPAKPAPVKAAASHCEGNCALCGRFARLKADGSVSCSDEERCANSRQRDAVMVAISDENGVLRDRVAKLEAALRDAAKAAKAAQK